jgi:hypothetical protein
MSLCSLLRHSLAGISIREFLEGLKVEIFLSEGFFNPLK